jgi:hypothetical protein
MIMSVNYSLFILFCFIFFYEDYKESDFYGYYSPIGYVNNFDTIQLKPNNLYQRRVYDKNKKLIRVMKGTWFLKKNNSIMFNYFYQNLDDDLVRFPELTLDTNMCLTTYFKIYKGEIKFCIGYHEGQNCFQKNK